VSSAPNVAINAKRNTQIAAPCLTTNLIISAESSLSVSDSSQRPVSDILRVRERTEDAGFDSVALSALPRPALFACGSLLTVTSPRPYHSLDPRPHRIGPRLPGQHGRASRPPRRLPRARSARKRAGICPQHEAGNWSLPQATQTLRQAKWSFRQVLFKLCNWGARLSSCSTE
jgi:hypothetical protein